MTNRTRGLSVSLATSAALVASLALPAPALACGGFFCSQTQPVNQTAERIIFADNGDGTVTAVIQIMYEGPSENFSWLLPISTVPGDDDIGVASDLAFQRLQAATNPRYTLTTRVEGTCKNGTAPPPVAGGGGPTVAAPSGGGGTQVEDAGGVMVEASGVVGAFEWTVISLDPDLDDPADVAVTWLEDNGYDVTAEAPDLLGPYLADGLYLLALRLTKGSDTGSIRPIVLTYDGDRPMIPIKLTAVAANEDMGVLSWVLGDARAVPYNYLSLELNEARINWFNAALNYNDVVIEAADEAGGQGFVTELATETESLQNVVWTLNDEQQWTNFTGRVFSSFADLFNTSNQIYGQWDGYWDAIRATVVLPDDVPFEDFRLCPTCYMSEVQFSPSELVAALEQIVIEPVRSVQELLDAHAFATRFYTTLSAAEMTLDPVFGFNQDLDTLSNVHTAERVIECSPDYNTTEAPWRIELPQGGELRGQGNAGVGTWPEELGDQPPNHRVVQAAESGQGAVLEDNAEEIEAGLVAYNDSIELIPPASGTGGTTIGVGGTTSSGGTTGAGGVGGSSGPAGGSGANAATDDPPKQSPDSGGCSLGQASDSSGWLLAFAGLGLARLRRRRRRR